MNPKVFRSGDFSALYAKLPRSIQIICDTQLERLARDSDDPRLQRKKLKGHDGIYSFRVTRRYRVLFYSNQSGEIIVFEIDHRKDVYR